MEPVLPEDVDRLGISLTCHFTRNDSRTDWRAQWERVALVDRIKRLRVVGLPHEPHKTPATFWVKLSEGRFHPAARGVQHTLHTRKLALRALQPEV